MSCPVYCSGSRTPTSSSFAEFIFLNYCSDGCLTLVRAHQFFELTSFSIALSRLNSATSLFSRSFSFSSSWPFCLLCIHIAIFLAPTVVGQLRDAGLSYRFRDTTAFSTSTSTSRNFIIICSGVYITIAGLLTAAFLLVLILSCFY